MSESGLAGPGVDAVGRSVKDPTENVLDLVRAEVKRQDDLREMARAHQEKLADVQHTHLEKIIDRDRQHAQELRQLETARLDAVREVDVGAVQTAAQAAENRAAALSTTLATTAEAVRATAEATRLATTELISSTVKPLADAIAVLQQAFNQGIGQRAQVVEQRDTKAESRGNTQLIWQIIAVVAVIAGLYLASQRGG